MSGIQERLAAEFANIADKLQREIAKLREKQSGSKKGDTQAKAALDAAELAVERLDSFNFQILGQVQCPQCWIWNGGQSTLRRERFVIGATILTCPICRYDLKLPP